MTGRRRLATLFALALLAMLALLWPLRLVLGEDELRMQRVSAIEIAGPVWNGTLRDARWRGTALGELFVSLRPWSSLTGVHRMRVRNDTASAVFTRGRVQGIEGLHGELPTLRIASMPGLELKLRFADATLTFADGHCREAAGAIQAELRLPGAAGTVAPIRLEGDVICVDRTGVANLASAADRAPGTLEIDATLQIDADGRYRVQSHVAAGDAATRLMLQALGFQDSPTGSSRVDSGSLLE